MTPERMFSRFRREIPPGTRGVSTVPEAGMCLSSFLVLSAPGKPGTVLLGRIDPRADWERIGAVDPQRAATVQNGWMLPSSHLLIYESPHEAARRIAREQLGSGDLTFGAPHVVSDTDPRPKAGPGALHWDLGFVFSGEWNGSSVPPPAAWSQLELVELSGVRPADIVRGQADILAQIGLRVGP